MDDSVIIRRSLTVALADVPEVTVAGSAASGRIALLKMPLLKPDVVVLALDMPNRDGLDTLATIRLHYPGTAVVLLDSPNPRSASVAGTALALGCRGCIIKPDAAQRSTDRLQQLAADVAGLIASAPATRADRPTVALPAETRSSVSHRIDVVAIGVSTGGPAALMELLSNLPAAFPVPVVIVQHMPPVFTRSLAERLDATCRITVAEGEPGRMLKPGDAWIAPGDSHMIVERHATGVTVNICQESPENSCRPSVDVLFRSVAQVFGPNALAVVMTGMGRDGVAGCREIRAAGGQIIVQDQPSSVVWGMPGLVVKADLADQVVPLDRLAQVITDRVTSHRLTTGDLVGR